MRMKIINREISRKVEITNRNKEDIYTRKGLKKSHARKNSKITAVLKIGIHRQAVNYKIL
jgi:hypothetical protein